MNRTYLSTFNYHPRSRHKPQSSFTTSPKSPPKVSKSFPSNITFSVTNISQLSFLFYSSTLQRYNRKELAKMIVRYRKDYLTRDKKQNLYLPHTKNHNITNSQSSFVMSRNSTAPSSNIICKNIHLFT